MAENEITPFPVVVIGGSAGSLEVILTIIKDIPADSGAVFILIVHRKNDKDSILEKLLSHKTRMAVQEVEDKEPILRNHLYVAPPDYHLLVEDERNFSLDSSEKVHYSRPSIDVTFESVAQVFGARVIGMLLSGANADGAEGLLKIKEAGGYTLVQDPKDADIAYMPQQAIDRHAACQVAPARELAEILQKRLSEK